VGGGVAEKREGFSCPLFDADGISSCYFTQKEESMKRIACLVGILVLGVSMVWAAGPKSYQVTGPILEVRDDVIVVEKGKEKWEIAKDKGTKVSGDLAVGKKVTVYYTMKATEIELKEAPAKPAAKEAPKKQ
jgi:hypothetical protein